MESLPLQTLNGAAVSDSDENNNDSQRTSSVSEVPNQVMYYLFRLIDLSYLTGGGCSNRIEIQGFILLLLHLDSFSD